MPNVLMVVASLEVGGLERYVINLAQTLRCNAVQPLVFCLSHQGALFNELPSDTTSAIGNPRTAHKILDWRILQQLIRFIRDQDIDVIHAHSRKAYIYGAAASLMTGRPLIISVHSLRHVTLRRKLFESLILRCAHHIISVSSEITGKLMHQRFVSLRKISTIQNGVDTELTRPVDSSKKPTIRQMLGLPTTGFILGAVGRIVPVKNYSLMIGAFSRLAAMTNDTYLVIVGDGEQSIDLKHLVRQLGLSERIFLVGEKTNTLEWYQAFDCFVLSSISEGTSMALLEAGACGLPAVVTDVGGNVDVVENQVNGLIIDSGNLDGMYQALHRIYTNRFLADQMGRAARLNIQKYYSLSSSVKAHLHIYQNSYTIYRNLL
jgi:glycosyltransferase involved in cell wall biosynthesis